MPTSDRHARPRWLPLRTRGGKLFSERGIALVAVSVAIAIMAMATTQFTYTTNVDYASAANARDEMRAYFLARSGMNLSRLVIKVQHDIMDKYRRYIGDMQLADYLPLMIGAFGGGKDEVQAITETLGLPAGMDGVKGLGVPEGQFDVRVTTDDDKINVNCANGSVQTQQKLFNMLSALVASASYDRMFEERDADGQFTDRLTFVRAIIDYVDRDTAGYGASGQPEDYGYEGLRDPYRAKDNYIDSVDELQLVRGMDDRRWAVFGPAFTVYGGCKVNLGAVNQIPVIMALIWQSAKNPDDPVLRPEGLPKLLALAMRVAQARAYGFMFDDVNMFAEFVKDPDAALAPLLGLDAASGGALGGMVQRVEGVELDPAKLNDVARTGGRRTYRVVASARIGRVEKTITGVWDTDTQNQNIRDPAYARGTWVFWREE